MSFLILLQTKWLSRGTLYANLERSILLRSEVHDSCRICHTVEWGLRISSSFNKFWAVLWKVPSLKAKLQSSTHIPDHGGIYVFMELVEGMHNVKWNVQSRERWEEWNSAVYMSWNPVYCHSNFNLPMTMTSCREPCLQKTLFLSTFNKRGIWSVRNKTVHWKQIKIDEKTRFEINPKQSIWGLDSFCLKWKLFSFLS